MKPKYDEYSLWIRQPKNKYIEVARIVRLTTSRAVAPTNALKTIADEYYPGEDTKILPTGRRP